MYATHQPIIEAACRDNVQTFVNAAAFAIISARAQFPRAVDDAAAWSAGKRKGLGCVFSWKWRALDELQENAEQRHVALYQVWRRQHIKMLGNIVASWHGYGLVKGGFVMQMATGTIGCIDSRNVDYFELNEKSVKNPSRPTQRQAYKHAQAYADLCRKLGGSARLWDIWCEYMASTSQVHEWRDNPFAVSAAHLHAIGITPPVTQPSVADTGDIPF